MKIANNKMIRTMFLGLILLLALPVVSWGQGRGQGRGRGHGSNQNWKCGKFVNCHDARDGRWDNRGPRARGNRIGDIYRNRRYRRTNRTNDIFVPRTRRIDRDGDGDFDRNDIRLGRRTRRINR